MYAIQRKKKHTCDEENLGKRITIHGFRHTHTTLSLDTGIYYKDVQKRLGHRTADMMMNFYAHAIGNDDEITKTIAHYIEN
ncbi:MAG: tyrosine-type recombinase/integrase [Tetragenococcus koreensis]|nr:tyrosine-type recombinase/integrase [Tetragenococcus koreensis]MDN6580943.1 tyrosine-type recombinase/integrase [Tetragenococcus koreensis]MDN6751063.1 tyrosine-type recombinase/integrase [Staphylococcus equorum]